MDPFVARVVIGVGVWVILKAVIDALIEDPKVNKIFHLTLLFLVVVYIFFFETFAKLFS